MKKALIVNDIHIGSEYCDDEKAKEKLDALDPKNPPKDIDVVVLNGDIVDLSACKKKHVKGLRIYQAKLQKKWDINYLRGNHDLVPEWYAFLKIGQTCFTHGHLLGDKERVKKWIKYENKEAGASKLKLIWIDIADDMDWIKGKRPLPQDIIDAAVKLAKKHKCVEIILGHYHPLKELKYVQDGVTVRCLPKGFNYVEIVG